MVNGHRISEANRDRRDSLGNACLDGMSETKWKIVSNFLMRDLDSACSGYIPVPKTSSRTP
jgi:hypothetical protein